ncbi:siphovirus ReqiPepy6 Gp37-like family protein [Actinoplanes sp. NPDC049265]|uniref:siphovirus ReqiPepy6 Gp37-like family protein n=1 Tax=Actinoplanes sp. NPDC049265 TaxID=3363902 RepID=UPI003719616C
MRLSDITVEVRDKQLNRLGLIRPEELDLTLQDAFNNVGTWNIAMAVEHPLAAALRTPGAGIVVTGPDDVLMSGPVTKAENSATADDPAGALTVEGVSDSCLLADVLAYPDPAQGDPTKQAKVNDQRTGPIESLMHAFVAANIGPSAPAARRPHGTLLSKVVMGTNRERGMSTSKSARFRVLGNLLSELATGSGLGFRMVQRGSTIAFETYTVADRTKQIRLDIYNSTLAGHKVAVSPPGATLVLVAGQNEGVKRRFVTRTNADAQAAEIEWGRHIEVFKDQRNTDVVAELERAGDEVLADEGFSTLAVQVVPMEDSAMPYGTAWRQGDAVTVVVEGQELSSTVTGFVIKSDATGFRVGAVIGAATGFDPDAVLARRVTGVETRVSQLEATGTPLNGFHLLTEADDEVSQIPPDGFDAGVTLTRITRDDSANWALPEGLAGYVMTVGDGGDDSYQTFATTAPDGNPEFYVDSGTGVHGWSVWRKLVTVGAYNAADFDTLSQVQQDWGTKSITIAPTASQWTAAVTFAKPFPVPPVVVPAISNANTAVYYRSLQCRAVDITTTGCTLLVYHPAGTVLASGSVVFAVQYHAVGAASH